MRKALSITLMLVVALAVTAYARPVDQSTTLQKFMSLQTQGSDFSTMNHQGVFGAAAAGTTYYGGTVWAADSNRWEALKDSVWTFDSGVGSDFDFSDPNVNPYKDHSLHAHMEGWIGIDFTYSEVSYFRRLSYADFSASADTCVGAVAGLDGQYSYWCGELPAEADADCFAGGQGYGNSWVVCVGQTFSYNGSGSVTWEFDYVNDTEPGWDYSVVYCDTTGSGDDVVVDAFTGPASGHASYTLTPGTDMRSDAGNIILKICVQSDGAYSDQDGYYVTDCGAFAFDGVSVSGGGISSSTDFESDNGGWALLPAAAGSGGDWSNIVQFTQADVHTVCGCALEDSVMAFYEPSSGGHTYYQDNVAASPWIDLKADGLAGVPGKFVQYDGYFELPLINYIFVQTMVQWYPAVCVNTGKLYMSPWTSSGFVYYFGGVATCRRAAEDSEVQIDLSSRMDLGAEQVRISVGVINYCRYYGNCSGVTNKTPYFDNVMLGVYGNPDAPYISARTIDVPQDSWPTNGTLRIDAPARVDCNNVKGGSVPGPNTVLGDTLVVQGGTGGAEVYVEFYVRPGPGTNMTTFNTWYNSHANGATRVGPWGVEQWKVARMDTCEVGGVVNSGAFMTTYHEADPNFSGDDTAQDPNDPHSNALLNDIFPDNLFTAGTRVQMFFKTRFVGGTDWFTVPDDTTGGNFIEMEVLPSSMDADSTFNCTLYVDHFDGRGAQPFIEDALATLNSATSNNYEKTWWDRFDVEAPSSGQESVGRPAGTDYGATALQLLGYKDIKWNSGNLNGSCLSQEDGNVLIPWIATQEPTLQYNNFYGSGDGLAESIYTEAATAPAAKNFMNTWAGVTFVCGRVAEATCNGSVDLPDTCIELLPNGTAYFYSEPLVGETSRAGVHLGQGNGCPTQRSFDVLAPLGTGAVGDENYYSPLTGTTVQFASINRDVNGLSIYRVVWDGLSVHYRRDSSEPQPCQFRTATYPSEQAVYERIREVEYWLGYADEPGNACRDMTAGTGFGDDLGRPAEFKTALANFAPNPLMNGAKGTIQFTMAREGKATVEVFDVSGRLIRKIFDGIANEGLNVTHWDGTDSSNRPVASGVYFYRLKTNGEEFAKKMVVVRNGN